MQQPIPSGYSARTTANHIVQGINLKGKIIIVTGGSAGLGLESAKALASAGAKVIVPARNVSKASQALAGLPNVELYPEEMDLSKSETIEAFGSWFQSRHDKLDILINSAGVMAIPLSRDDRGNEMQISANYLGHYHLINKLLPQLKKANEEPGLSPYPPVPTGIRRFISRTLILFIRHTTNGWLTDKRRQPLPCSALR
ncbi:SDR family NAD(P)-dependent oxidoreductase [Paenibacillus glycanilyticus]|uniref:SDR family NAD(P)-dependent oxidoreductase n=1 Tax=Paenibacillus glycanilyticus TaxID=126569 RepID=UPI001F2EFC09|nr:SDR family NAD(P)-dependent oxidoreductase [Paenibacillus glycanilyticus]